MTAIRKLECLLLSVCLSLCGAAALAQEEAAIGIIGGADGPTAIFVAGNGLTDLVEAQIPGMYFADMSDADVAQAVGKLPALITEAYRFFGRATEGGERGYLVGVCVTAPSPLADTGLQSVIEGDGPEVYEIVRNDAEQTVLCRYTDTYLAYHPQRPEMLYLTLHSEDALLFAPIFNLLLNGDFAYLQDVAQRGALVVPPAAPYLDVTMYKDGAYRREYLPLTDDDLMKAAASSHLYSPEELGDYALRVIREGDDPDEYVNALIPAPLVEMAKEKCGFEIASPREVGSIVSASMSIRFDGSERTQTITDGQQLSALETMLRNAKRTPMGGCPYTGVLTLTMADGSTLTLQKATDSCDGILFGSMAHYELGREANEAFWQMFAEAYSVMQQD